MTVKFPSWGDRDKVAALLEAPARTVVKVEAGEAHAMAWADVHAIIAELDRIDRVTVAKTVLNRAQDEWQQSIRERYVVIAPAEPGVMCVQTSGGRYWKPDAAKYHKAKATLNGTPYCGTHLARAERNATYSAYSAHRDEKVPPADAKVIIDADRELREQRQRAGQ